MSTCLYHGTSYRSSPMSSVLKPSFTISLPSLFQLSYCFRVLQSNTMPIKLFSKRKGSKDKNKLSRKGSKNNILEEDIPAGASGGSTSDLKVAGAASMLSNSTSSGSDNSAKLDQHACKQCGLLMKNGTLSQVCQLCVRLDPTFGQYLTGGQVSVDSYE